MTSSAALPTVSEPALGHLPLPLEIRNAIYTYVLTEYDDLSNPDPLANDATGQVAKDCKPNTSSLSLLLVSRQIFLEAYPIFYRVNTFTFGNIGSLQRFLKNIGFARRQYLTRIRFSW